MQQEITDSSSRRNLRSFEPSSYPEYVERWAIIVGISKYEKEVSNLKYADRDAEELYKLIQTPSGGGFEADHIKKLINEEATMANVTRALRSFMKKPAKDDIALIYFACHGAPDPDKPNNVYLLTYDTDPDDIAGTAMPMREISLSLQENLLAERVVIVADTCHSAAIGGGVGRRSINSTAVVNRYLEQLSESQEGIAMLTSAEANEVSLEDEKWGGGHGVFTYYLLEGMKGEADAQPRDGIVTVGELFEYVRESVQKATGNQQHPSIGTGKYDRRLPMAVTGGTSAQEHYQLGCHLYKMGWILDDKRLFESARAQFDEALHLSRLAETTLPEAHFQIGLTLAALKEHGEAIQVFKRVIEQDKAQVLSDAPFQLGIAYARMGNYKGAQTVFETFLQQDRPMDNPHWVREYVKCLDGMQASKLCALLIGCDEYTDSSLGKLSGPSNDVHLMEEFLVHQLGFQKESITILLNAHATYGEIIAALNHLKNNEKQYDTAIIYYSGHGISGESDAYLFVYDSKIRPADDAQMSMTIGAEELHLLINDIPIKNKTLILDTHANSKFLRLAEKEANYALFVATKPEEMAGERLFGPKGAQRVHGVFTHDFVQQLSETNLQEATYGQIILGVARQIPSYGFKQTPLFIGMRERLLFSGIDDYLMAFDFSQRKNYTSLTLRDLRQRYTRYQKQITSVFPQLYYSFGRAFIEKGNCAEAIDALQTAINQGEKDYPDAILALCCAQVGALQHSEALASFQKYISLAQPPLSAAQGLKLFERLVHGRKHALLVGINTYINPEVTDVRGAVNDVRGLKDVLCNRLGFQEENITVLLDQEATRSAIIKAFKQLLEKSHDEPALFYFAGNGSADTRDAPTIVSVDGRQAEVFDIELQELSALASSASSLVTIIDAGWTFSSEPLVTSRTIQRDMRTKPGKRHIEALRDTSSFSLQIGCVSFYNDSIEISGTGRSVQLESEFPESQIGTKKMFYGHLTHALFESLNETDPSSLTYSQLMRLLSDKISKPVVLGQNLDQIIFKSPNAALELFKEYDLQFTNQVIYILRLLIERRGDVYPEGFLNLGKVYALRGEYTKSIDALKKAILQHEDNFYPEAHYYLGRILFESKIDWAEAVSTLRKATEQEPDNAPAYYYLGQAIRSLVEQESLAQMEQALQTYLEKGAPLGHEDEVEEFLASRRSGTR